MANRKVVLVWLCKTERGWRRYPVRGGKSGKVKTGFVLVGGEEREYPEGRYQLRTYEGSRMVYKDAGKNAVAALTAQTKEEHLLMAKASAKDAGVKIENEEAPSRLNLARELTKFVEKAVDRGSPKAAEAYRQAGDDFLKIIGRTYADEITEDDVLKHLRALRKRGQAPRTIHNRHVCIVSFLKHLKLDAKALAPSSPKYEKSVPEAYSSEELTAFFASVKDEHLSLTFELLLKTGLRERAVFLFWENIDLADGILRVRSKPDLGFTIKDSEERNVPIPNDLLERLRAYRIKHPDIRYVTGTRSDQPNLKLLSTLKRLVNSAGLACGKCNGCKRIRKPKHKEPNVKPVRATRKDARGECENWWLHKFRSTCITQLLRSGMDLRTVMKFSGHSDLASVMRYLSPAGDEAIKAQVNAVKWM